MYAFGMIRDLRKFNHRRILVASFTDVVGRISQRPKELAETDDWANEMWEVLLTCWDHDPPVRPDGFFLLSYSAETIGCILSFRGYALLCELHEKRRGTGTRKRTIYGSGWVQYYQDLIVSNKKHKTAESGPELRRNSKESRVPKAEGVGAKNEKIQGLEWLGTGDAQLQRADLEQWVVIHVLDWPCRPSPLASQNPHEK
ncbi:hypothetical protein BDV93DRAFT_514034 [Ceratobasidium sp. AG-I]|nr:hypothetical protein BDV93DRAFT_514034 [Ceratobasidium sp. AG-I]